MASSDIVRSDLTTFGGALISSAVKNVLLVEPMAMHTARDHQDEEKRDRADPDVQPLRHGETEKGPLALAVGGQLIEKAIRAAVVCGGECANPQ